MKPASGFKKNTPAENKTAVLDKTEKSESTDKPSRYARTQRLDPLTERLGAKGFFHKMRWSWFTYEFGGLYHPLEVTRFYAEKKLAIDIDLKDKNLSKYKQQILELHNIKYAVLNNAADFQSLEKVL